MQPSPINDTPTEPLPVGYDSVRRHYPYWEFCMNFHPPDGCTSSWEVYKGDPVKLYCDSCLAKKESDERIKRKEEEEEFQQQPLPEDDTQTKIKPFYLLTINPKNSINPEDFFEFVNTYMATSEYTKDQRFVYAFEQRGETVEDIHGFHCHILVAKRTPKPDNLYITLRKALFRRDWIGDNKHVDVKHVSTKDLGKVINYITGDKSEESKKQKQICDILMRRKYNLEPYYRNKIGP